VTPFQRGAWNRNAELDLPREGTGHFGLPLQGELRFWLLSEGVAARLLWISPLGCFASGFSFIKGHNPAPSCDCFDGHPWWRWRAIPGFWLRNPVRGWDGTQRICHSIAVTEKAGRMMEPDGSGMDVILIRSGLIQ